MNSQRVAIINAGSAFRGLLGTVAEIKENGMRKVVFDSPLYGFTYSLFFSWEIENAAPRGWDEVIA